MWQVAVFGGGVYELQSWSGTDTWQFSGRSRSAAWIHGVGLEPPKDIKHLACGQHP